MKIQIDENSYQLFLKKPLDDMQSKIHLLFTEGIDITVKDESGNPVVKHIAMKQGNLARIGGSAVLAPMVMPMLEGLYEGIGREVPKPTDRKKDFVEFMLEAMIDFFRLIEGDVNLYVESVQDDNGVFRTFTTVTPVRQLPIDGTAFLPEAKGEGDEEDTEALSGGETHLRGGQDGDGQDDVYQGNDRQVVRPPTVDAGVSS